MTHNTTTSHSIDNMLWDLEKLILNTHDFGELIRNIVDGMLFELGYLKHGYKIVVLSLPNPETLTLDRAAISQTDEAKMALQLTPVPFKKILIPLSNKENLLCEVLRTKTSTKTRRMYDILTPIFTEEQADTIQRSLGIKSILIYPLVSQEKIQGVLNFSLDKELEEIKDEELVLLRRFTDIAALAVQNVTLFQEVKDAYTKLEKSYEDLKTLDRLKDEFVSITSHDLRTPLTIMRTHLWRVIYQLSDSIKDQKTLELIKISYESTERMIKLVNNTLTISQIDAGKFALHKEKGRLEPLLTAINEEFQDLAASRHIGLALELPNEPLPDLMLDKDRVREVITNLISNALNYTQNEKGTVKVKLEKLENNAKISITDNGKGISKEDMERLFKKFGRLEHELSVYSSSATGIGLGLYISKQLVELHGGEIIVESVKDQGSTFSFTLPL